MNERVKTALAITSTASTPEALQPTSPAPYYMSYGTEEGNQLRVYWRSIQKRLWLVIGLTLIVAVLTGVVMLRLPNVYEARARVRVDLENTSPMFGAFKNNSVVVNSPTNDPAYFNTQLQVLGGEGLLRRTVETLDLEHNKAFLARQNEASIWSRLERLTNLSASGSKSNTTGTSDSVASATANTNVHEDLEKAARLSPFVEAVQKNLKIEPVKETRLSVKETRLIDIQFRDTDPRMAARLVNAVADSFILSNLEKKTETGTSAGDFMQKRIAELQTQIRSGEEKLINYAKGNQILSLDASQNTVVERLAGLNRQLLEAENERNMAEAAFRAAKSPGAAAALAEENSKDPSNIEPKLAELRQHRAQLLVDYTEEWPEIKEIDEQIAALDKQKNEASSRATAVVTTNLETRYKQAVQREEVLRASFSQQRGETLQQNEAAINYRIIQQEIETNKNLLDGLLQKAKENDVTLAGTPNNISIADYAIVPAKPVGPQRVLGILLATVMALAFGLCLAILLEYLDNTVRSASDVEGMLGLPALAVIPSVGGLAKSRLLPSFGKIGAKKSVSLARRELLINATAQTPLGEAYKQLRTSVLLSTAGRAPKTMLITSAQPGEGKTTTAVNTAFSLAQTQARVLIIDADMRRPRVHSVFEMSNVVGLSTILSRQLCEADVLSVINCEDKSGLSVLTSGAVPPNPAELLGSEQMRNLLKILDPHFDFIVIDSPPVASVTDGVLLASLVDGVILVVQGERSSRPLVRRAKQMLQSVGASIFGVVLNNVNVAQHDSYYYQGYYGNPYVSAEPGTGQITSIPA